MAKCISCDENYFDMLPEQMESGQSRVPKVPKQSNSSIKVREKNENLIKNQ
jgi:hypothetical protein